MTPTNNTQRNTKGLSFPLQPGTQLGLAILIVEDEEGNYEPVATVSTIGEVREIAAYNFETRFQQSERGEDVLCPFRYKVWAQCGNGAFRSYSRWTRACGPAKSSETIFFSTTPLRLLLAPFPVSAAGVPPTSPQGQDIAQQSPDALPEADPLLSLSPARNAPFMLRPARAHR